MIYDVITAQLHLKCQPLLYQQQEDNKENDSYQETLILESQGGGSVGRSFPNRNGATVDSSLQQGI